MKKKLTTMLSLLTVSAIALAGCGGGAKTGGNSTEPSPSASTAPSATPAPSSDDNKPFTVTLRHILIKESQQKELARMQDVKKELEGKIPGLTFKLEGLEEQVHRWQKLRAEMSAGNPPQIFNLFGGTDVKDFAKTGNLLDLTPILDELGLKDSFYNLSEFTVDGKVYGLPLAGFVEGLFYNKQIFEENELQVPKTWDELLDVSEKLKSKGITPIALGGKDAWVVGMPLNTLWVRMAGNDVTRHIVAGQDDDGNPAKWTDPGIVAGFEKFQELVKKGYFSKNALGLSYAQGQNEFQTGKAAMTFDGAWANGAFTDPNLTPVAEHVSFTAFPTMGGPGDNSINASYSNGYGFSSKLNEQELEVVKEFIKIQYSEAMQTRQNQEDGWLPSMKFEIAGSKPILKEILNSTEGKDLFPAFDSEVQGKVNNAMQTAVQEALGLKDINQTLSKLQAVQDEAIAEDKAQNK